MAHTRRGFVTALCSVASTGILAKVEAAGEHNLVRGRTYVAACPPVKASIPRTPGPYRIMVIGGHPDDADIICGCTAAKLVKKGCRVKFVAACNGDLGHHRHDRETVPPFAGGRRLTRRKSWGSTATTSMALAMRAARTRSRRAKWWRGRSRSSSRTSS